MKVRAEVSGWGAGCDDPAGRHLGRGGPANPPQKEQCRRQYVRYCALGQGCKDPKPLRPVRSRLVVHNNHQH